MAKWVRFLAAWLVASSLCLAGADSPDIAAEIRNNLRQLEKVSGLQSRKETPYEILTRDKVNKYLKARLKESVKPEDIRAEQLILRKFGFVSPDFDLEKSTIDLLTEQAAAFYDFRRKRLFLTDWTSSEMQQTALVHELAHALADQAFNLGRFIKQAGPSDDSAMARMAVMEGQATWLMSEVEARQRGQTLIGNPSLAEVLSRSGDSGSSQYPVFNSVPLYLKETLVFPYSQGMRFQQAVVEKMGREAFAAVFRRPPESTHEILHPEVYFAREKPARPTLPELRIKGYRKMAEGMVGELDCAILLEQYLSRSEARDLAPHWRGGVYAVYENKPKTRSVLTFAITWDSPGAAGRFMQAYQKVLAGKWKRYEPVAATGPGVLRGCGDDGAYEVTLDGSVVRSVEGREGLLHCR